MADPRAPTEPWLPDWFWDEPPPAPDPETLRALAKMLRFDLPPAAGHGGPLTAAELDALVQQIRGTPVNPALQHNSAFDVASLLGTAPAAQAPPTWQPPPPRDPRLRERITPSGSSYLDTKFLKDLPSLSPEIEIGPNWVAWTTLESTFKDKDRFMEGLRTKAKAIDIDYAEAEVRALAHAVATDRALTSWEQNLVDELRKRDPLPVPSPEELRHLLPGVGV